MHRVAALLGILCLWLIAAPAALAADEPPADEPAAEEPLEELPPTEPTPGKTTKPERQEAKLKLALAGLDGSKLRLGDKARATAKLRPSLSGEPLRFTLKRGKKVVDRQTLSAGSSGEASWSIDPIRPGAYRVKVQHPRSTRVAPALEESKSFSIAFSSLGSGNYGRDVEIFKNRLRSLGYAVDGGSGFSAATGRAVLAYRKANGMPRTEAATKGIVRRVLSGKGAVKLRYPKAGRHVEADISRQILILADDGKPVEVYHTSSGTSATPTILGKYTFYMQGPGYNAKGMYYSSYFIRGYAIHGYDPVPTYPASHGCLRVPIPDARHIYDWVDIGMTIYTYR